MNLYHTQSTKQFVEGTTPAAPTSGVVTLFASEGGLSVIDSAGNITEIGGGGGVTVSDTAPSSPASGDLWFNSDTGSLYVWYVDADGGQWVLPDSNISTGTVDLSSQVSDILPVENGGTGASSLSSVSLSSFSSESATDGYVATADGAGSIVWEEAAVGLTNFTEGRDDTGINASTPVVSLSATGAETNIDAAIIPKGTGALLTAVPDGTAAGGNKRGSGAVDLNTSRSSASQVSSGSYSFISGRNNTASGSTVSIAIGDGNTASGNQRSCAIGGAGNSATANYTATIGGQGTIASGQNSTIINSVFSQATGSGAVIIGGASMLGSSANSFAHGYHAVTNIFSEYVHSAQRIESPDGRGTAQYSRVLLQSKTSDATPVKMSCNYLAGNNQFPYIQNNFIWGFIAEIVGVKSDGSDMAHYLRQGQIKNVSGTTTLVGSIITIGTDYEDNSSTNVAISADDTNDSLAISVTGVASETWRWFASLKINMLKFGL